MIIQGRGDYNYWVTGFKLSYTLDGKNWMDYENEKKFNGSTDRSTKVKHALTPFYAVTVRLTVLSYYGLTCMRFGMTFLKEAWFVDLLWIIILFDFFKPLDIFDLEVNALNKYSSLPLSKAWTQETSIVRANPFIWKRVVVNRKEEIVKEIGLSQSSS